MRWSVSLVAEGDREIGLEEVVALADAVAGYEGIATGMGTHSYGVQVVVDTETSAEAVDQGMAILAAAAEVAGLPLWPVVTAETISDEEDAEWLDDIPDVHGLGDWGLP